MLQILNKNARKTLEFIINLKTRQREDNLMMLHNIRGPWMSLRGAAALCQLALVWLFIVTVLLGHSANAQPLMQPNISLAQARQIVDAVIAECSQPGDLVTVSVAVVDRAGQPVMQISADTASPHNWELVYRKAYTARTFRRTSLDWRDRTAGDSERAGQRQLTDVIPLGGGAPIMMGDQPLGGVGVSGAEGGQPADSACAEAGVAAIADELK
jgi:uncharacterized protein GlcG (DUF336 family)